MEDLSFDDDNLSLTLEDLTPPNFLNDDFDTDEAPLSPCVVTPSTPINPAIVSDSECDLSVPAKIPTEEGTKGKKKKKKPDGSRSTYLVTYSRADVVKVRGRQHFGEIVAEQFNRNDDVVEYWACSAEIHRVEGIHYHLSIKLSKKRRFAEVRNNLKKIHDIDVDFKFFPLYHDAYTYMRKYDPHFVVSENHLVLDNPPRTLQASRAVSKQKAPNSPSSGPSEKKKAKPYRPPNLTTRQVCQIVRDNDIASEDELYAFADEQASVGKGDLLGYLYDKPNLKHHADILATVERVKTSRQRLERKKKSALEIIEEAKDLPCEVDPVTNAPCDGLFLTSALEVLAHNNITRKRFSDLVLNTLKFGRGKGRNLMIIGKTNCAKTFILTPLTKIYKCFMTPSKGSYNWVNAPSKEIIFLNDLRYDKDGDDKVMPWSTFLNFLDGSTINVSRPKNNYPSDLEWSAKQPVFATAEKPIVRVVGGEYIPGETEQMNERWEFLTFTHQFLKEKNNINYNITPCGACFAKLILDA